MSDACGGVWGSNWALAGTRHLPFQEIPRKIPALPGRAFMGRALTVSEVCALSDLDNISVRIADVAPGLAVLGDRRRDELRSPAFP